MNRRLLYLILAVIGFVVPYYFFISFLTAYGLDGKAFVEQLFGAEVSAFFAVDLLLSCVVFVVYLRREAARYSIERWWVYLAALFVVGLSFALPLFLWARESRLESIARAAKPTSSPSSR